MKRLRYIIVNVLKTQTFYTMLFCLFSIHLFHKILGGKANSADPDQTALAVRSGSALFAYASLLDKLVYEILRCLLECKIFLYAELKDQNMWVCKFFNHSLLMCCILA